MYYVMLCIIWVLGVAVKLVVAQVVARVRTGYTAWLMDTHVFFMCEFLKRRTVTGMETNPWQPPISGMLLFLDRRSYGYFCLSFSPSFFLLPPFPLFMNGCFSRGCEKSLTLLVSYSVSLNPSLPSTPHPSSPPPRFSLLLFSSPSLVPVSQPVIFPESSIHSQ